MLFFEQELGIINTRSKKVKNKGSDHVARLSDIIEEFIKSLLKESEGISGTSKK